MYIFTNAVKNLGRNKGRNIILGIIMMCLLAVASISMSIDSTTKSIKESYKQQYGSEVFMQPDFERIMAEAESNSLPKLPQITQKNYEDLMESDYLKETKILYNWGIKSSNVEPVMSEQLNKNNGIGGMVMGGQDEDYEEPQFTLIAYSDLKYFNDFDEGTRKFTSGDIFENDNEAIISEDFAKLNNLEVGSKFKINLSGEKNETELTVSGIYLDNKESQYGGMIFAAFMDPKNEIIVSEGTLKNMETNGSNWASASYTFYLSNPDDLKAFNDDAHARGISEYYNMATDEMAYNQMVRPIEGIAKTSMMFLVVFLAFGCGLVVLLSILSVRERKYEVGVLRAIGMKKAQVMRTLLYESFITMAVCLILGLGIGALAAEPVANSMLNSQKQNNQGGSGGAVTMAGQSGPNFDEIEVEDVRLDAEAMGKVSIVGILVALVSTSVGIIYVLRYEPMEILVERN